MSLESKHQGYKLINSGGAGQLAKLEYRWSDLGEMMLGMGTDRQTDRTKKEAKLQNDFYSFNHD